MIIRGKLMKMLVMGAATLTLAGLAQAEILSFDCKAPEGKSYYAEGGIISADEAGWTDDGVANGHFVLRLNSSKGSISYQYKDATGGWWNPAEDEGAFVQLVAVNGDYSGSLQVVVITSGDQFSNVTSLVLTGMYADNTRLLMTSARHGMMHKSTTMIANCEATVTETGQ